MLSKSYRTVIGFILNGMDEFHWNEIIVNSKILIGDFSFHVLPFGFGVDSLMIE